MRRCGVAAALTCALCACTLLTSTDGLTGGAYAPDASLTPPTAPPNAPPPPSGDDAGGDAAPDAPTPVTADQHRAIVMADGPLAYYRLADSAGNVAKDETGNFDGTYFGALGYAKAGPFAGQSRSVHFGGSPQRIEANALANRGGSWTDLTIEAWVASELAPGSEGDIAQFADPSGSTVISLFRDDTTNGIKAHVGDFYPQASAMLLDTDWHHVALTMASNTITLYVDGASVAQTAGAQAVPASGLFGIGVDWNAADGGATRSSYWHGRLAEIAIYEKALTATQIATHAMR
ncbi:MAG TPA: LamG domain-containing protein [Labilithrix sp.]|jgi:hypothetical protein